LLALQVMLYVYNLQCPQSTISNAGLFFSLVISISNIVISIIYIKDIVSLLCLVVSSEVCC